MAEKSYDDMTVEELEDELEERGLPKSGNKDDLVQRLEKNDEVLSGDGGDGGDTTSTDDETSTGGTTTQADPAENPAVPTKEPEERQPAGALTAPAVRRETNEEGEVTEEEVGVFVGVDPDYQNFANPSDAPLLSESGVEREAEERSIKAHAESQKRSARVGVTGYSPGSEYDLGREDVGPSPTSKPDEEEPSSEEE